MREKKCEGIASQINEGLHNNTWMFLVPSTLEGPSLVFIYSIYFFFIETIYQQTSLLPYIYQYLYNTYKIDNQ